MAKNLFLEGPVRTGKSTLLRECLAPYKDVLGGFSCVRYRDENDDIRAYGLAGPGSAVDGTFDPSVTPDNSSVFLLFETLADGSNKTIKRLETFETVGLKMLNSSTSRIILLDELGGIELKSDKFRSRICELLASDIPCIGVMKKKNSRGILNSHHSKIAELNDAFRNDLIEKFDSEIIEFTAEKTDEIRNRVETFLSEINL